jgi:PemK-like, MazF-like toxin of type II toxin-antitoxin system
MSDELPRATYAPENDGEPDPGEVVWAWVPYEDDPQQGKDRPMLVLAKDGDHWLGLQLTSKDHDRDAEQETSLGRLWMDVGIGDWDRERRPSEVRINRLLRIPGSGVRREGAALEPQVFDSVVAAARQHLNI